MIRREPSNAAAGSRQPQLDALCGRLRLAAEDAERHAPSPPKIPLPRQPPPGISDLLIAAEMIQDTAATVITSLFDAGELSELADDSRAEGIRRHFGAAAARIDSAARATVGFRGCGGPAAGADPPHDERPGLTSRV